MTLDGTSEPSLTTQNTRPYSQTLKSKLVVTPQTAWIQPLAVATVRWDVEAALRVEEPIALLLGSSSRPRLVQYPSNWLSPETVYGPGIQDAEWQSCEPSKPPKLLEASQ